MTEQEIIEAADRVLRGVNVTPIAPMCGALLGLKRKLARASGKDEQDAVISQMRQHHRICACGKVNASDNNAWIWEEDANAER